MEQTESVHQGRTGERYITARIISNLGSVKGDGRRR
jgi:hypothetical protein